MERFQQKICYEAVSRLWKGLGNIKHAPNNTVPMSVEDRIKLPQQAVFLLGQALISILYIRCLEILKPLLKNPKRDKNIFSVKGRFATKN